MPRAPASEPLAVTEARGPRLDAATARSLTAGWFAGLMRPLGPWGAARRVAVAVSGGADSLCLAWLTASWGAPYGLIVDHGLRPGSAQEAEIASRRLGAFGVPSRILTLRVPAGPGLAARARRMRYAALSQAAADEGLSDLLVGHHAGDQAETVLIRRRAQSGPAGLSGMAAVVETRSLRLVRPLLGVAPARLRATLREQGIGWTEDPSNADPAATRTRVRAALSADMLRREALEQAMAAGRDRCRRDGEIAGFLAERVTLFPLGHALLSPGAMAPDCLAALLRMLGGAPYAADGRALARLAACPTPATLGGVRLLAAGRLGSPPGAGLLLVREEAAMQPAVAARAGAVWDGRFQLVFDGVLPDGALLGALAGGAARLRRWSALPSSVLRTLPALSAPEGGLAVPQLGYFCGWTNFSVRLTFSPPNPAAGASFRVQGLGDA